MSAPHVSTQVGLRQEETSSLSCRTCRGGGSRPGWDRSNAIHAIVHNASSATQGSIPSSELKLPMDGIEEFVRTAPAPAWVAIGSIFIMVFAVLSYFTSQVTRKAAQSPAARPLEGADRSKIPFVMKQAGSPSNGHTAFLHRRAPAEIMKERAATFYETMNMRRSVRFFADEPIPEGVLETVIATAGTSPSGAHQQPWTFVVVRNPAVRQQIREAVEREEQLNYERRMRRGWVDDVKGMVDTLHGTDGTAVAKPYLTDAAALIVVMKQEYGIAADGTRKEHYYAEKGAGIATGMLIAALQYVGLVTLTSTPMGAERSIRDACGRPENEKVFLLMPVGFAASNATVPYRTADELRKPYDELAVHLK